MQNSAERKEGPTYLNDKVWYESLARDQKRRCFEGAIKRFPYLSNMMKMHGVRASDPNFTEHFTFKLFMDIIHS